MNTKKIFFSVKRLNKRKQQAQRGNAIEIVNGDKFATDLVNLSVRSISDYFYKVKDASRVLKVNNNNDKHS